MFDTTEDTLKNLSQVLQQTSKAFQRYLVTAEVKEKLLYYISSLMTLFCIRYYLTVMWDCLIVGTFQDPLCTEHRMQQRHRIAFWRKKNVHPALQGAIGPLTHSSIRVWNNVLSWQVSTPSRKVYLPALGEAVVAKLSLFLCVLAPRLILCVFSRMNSCSEIMGRKQE